MTDFLSKPIKTEDRPSDYPLRDFTFKEYEDVAKITATYSPIGASYVYPVLGLAGEAGEVANKVKKVFRDNNGILSEDVRLSILEEVGDCAWYLAQISRELGSSLEKVCLQNNKKLLDRLSRGAIKGQGDKR